MTATITRQPVYEFQERTRAPHPTATSASKRKQHRSCDQCRKGKRACDVVLLDEPETALGWSPDGAPNGYSNFDQGSRHGSVSSAGPCSNCMKTGKQCTLEWLQSMKPILQQRKRNMGDKPQPTQPAKVTPDRSAWISSETHAPAEVSCSPTDISQDAPVTQSGASEQAYAQEFEELERVDSHSSVNSAPIAYDHIANGNGTISWSPVLTLQQHTDGSRNTEEFAVTETDFSDGSGHNSRQIALDFWEPTPPSSNGSVLSGDNGSLPIKRRRVSNGSQRTCSSASEHSDIQFARSDYSTYRRTSSGRMGTSARNLPPFINDPSPDGLEHRLILSTNRSRLMDGLVKIYHDSMENALSCWLTERTCPYNTKPGQVTTLFHSPRRTAEVEQWGPNWTNRVFARVCRLDKVSSSIRGRSLTNTEEKAVSRALNLAIISFATQWAQSSNRSTANYTSFGHDATAGLFTNGMTVEFDRSIQEKSWHQARRALQDTEHIESSRVIFAHIIFALTQRPLDVDQHIQKIRNRWRKKRESGGPDDVDREDDVPDLEEVTEIEGPPVFLETAARQIFAYRAKLEQIERRRKAKLKQTNGNGMPNDKIRADPLSSEDRETFDLLFWLAVMFDTLSSAMTKRPLVVSDEDSDILPAEDPNVGSMGVQEDDLRDIATSFDPPKDNSPKLWGDYFLSLKQTNTNHQVPRWPCSYEEAAATLVDAAPVKVLLFRKVTLIQTMLSRRVRHERLEKAIQEGLKVYRHWNSTYGRFMQDCVENHDRLPPRIQSWYVILGGHFHLAGLLLTDVIQSIDDAQLGLESQRHLRQSSNLVARLRKQNSYTISDLGRVSAPRQDASFAASKDFHFALNKGALLIEPWTVVLIRSFAKAGNSLLNMAVQAGSTWQSPGSYDPEAEHARVRTEYCVEALWHLGKKSDMAFLAATALSTALKEKTQPKVSPVPSDFSTMDDLSELDMEAILSSTMPETFNLNDHFNQYQHGATDFGSVPLQNDINGYVTQAWG